jgi:predicted transglutaminase-like cysteine proteinase
MRSALLLTLLLLTLLLLTGCVSPRPAMEAGATIPAPRGAVDYCRRHPEAPLCQ